MTMQEQELTLFGGWAKAQIPQQIEIGVEKPSGTLLPSISLNYWEEPISIENLVAFRYSPYVKIEADHVPVIHNGRVYPDIVNARWAVFFDAAGASYSYGKVPPFSGASPEQLYPQSFASRFRASFVRVLSAYPSERELSLARGFLRSSFHVSITFLYGDAWNKDLRTFKSVSLNRASLVYGSSGPGSTEKIESYPWISGFHIHALAQVFNIHLWIIHGKLYLYSNESIIEWKDHPDWRKDVLGKFGATPWQSRLRAVLNYLFEIRQQISQNFEGKSAFLRSEDTFPLDDRAHRRECNGPHNTAVDDFLLLSAREDTKRISDAYEAAKQARFEHGELRTR